MTEAFDPAAVVTAYVEYFNACNRDGWLSLFAPDAEHVDPVGRPGRRGVAAIAEFWDRAFARADRIRLEPTLVITAGDEAIMVMVVRSEQADRLDEIDGVDHFRFDPQGRITAIRAFAQLRSRHQRG